MNEYRILFDRHGAMTRVGDRVRLTLRLPKLRPESPPYGTVTFVPNATFGIGVPRQCAVRLDDGYEVWVPSRYFERLFEPLVQEASA